MRNPSYINKECFTGAAKDCAVMRNPSYINNKCFTGAAKDCAVMRTQCAVETG